MNTTQQNLHGIFVYDSPCCLTAQEITQNPKFYKPKVACKSTITNL
jgi:hypothetical protein